MHAPCTLRRAGDDQHRARNRFGAGVDPALDARCVFAPTLLLAGVGFVPFLTAAAVTAVVFLLGGLGVMVLRRGVIVAGVLLSGADALDDDDGAIRRTRRVAGGVGGAGAGAGALALVLLAS